MYRSSCVIPLTPENGSETCYKKSGTKTRYRFSDLNFVETTRYQLAFPQHFQDWPGGIFFTKLSKTLKYVQPKLFSAECVMTF